VTAARAVAPAIGDRRPCSGLEQGLVLASVQYRNGILLGAPAPHGSRPDLRRMHLLS